VLNIYNPCNVSGGLQLDLSRWEERQVVKMLIHLSTVEPGENCKKEFCALFCGSPGCLSRCCRDSCKIWFYLSFPL
jgi:hypothetical protein